MSQDTTRNKGRLIFLNRFYYPDESATAQILTDLAEHLAASGRRVEVVTSRLFYESKDDQSELPRRETVNGVTVQRLWSTAFGRVNLLGRLLDYATIYFSFLLYLIRDVAERDIVVVKTDPPLLSILGWFIRIVRPFTLVSWCQDLFPEVAEKSIGKRGILKCVFRSLKGLRNASFNGCDSVVVISEDMKQYLRDTGIRTPIDSLPNWAIQKDGETDVSFTSLREQWGLKNKVVLGYSGNLGHAHDYQTLIGALPDLQMIDNLTILFIGGGVGLRKLKEQVSGFPEGLLEFLPYQPRSILRESLKVPHLHWFSLIPEMSAFVYPSKFYGILESGRPVIFVGAGSSALAQFIIRHECGYVVSPGDSKAFAVAVKELCADTALRDRLGANAHAADVAHTARSHQLAQWERHIGQLEQSGNGDHA